MVRIQVCHTFQVIRVAQEVALSLKAHCAFDCHKETLLLLCHIFIREPRDSDSSPVLPKTLNCPLQQDKNIVI